MSELNIKEPRDLKKLVGWIIDEVTITPAGVVLRMSHLAAACPVDIIIRAETHMGLSGNVVIANSGLFIEARDVVLPQEKGD